MCEAKRAEERNDPRVRREPKATSEPRAWKVVILARILFYAASQVRASTAQLDWKAPAKAPRAVKFGRGGREFMQWPYSSRPATQEGMTGRLYFRAASLSRRTGSAGLTY